MREIQLTKGYVALVDDDDFDMLMTHRWKAQVTKSGHVYAIRSIFRMHRVVMGVVNDMVVDHINGNTLDNRKNNLRICSQEQNAKNRGIRKIEKSSRFKGVVYSRNSSCWIAAIRKDGNRKSLGYFDHEIDAALAYNIAAQKLFGEYARLNQSEDLIGADISRRRVPKHDGIRNGRAKLDPESAEAIRHSSEKTEILAARYGVGKSTIIRARNGECWGEPMKQVIDVASLGARKVVVA